MPLRQEAYMGKFFRLAGAVLVGTALIVLPLEAVAYLPKSAQNGVMLGLCVLYGLLLWRFSVWVKRLH